MGRVMGQVMGRSTTRHARDRWSRPVLWLCLALLLVQVPALAVPPVPKDRVPTFAQDLLGDRIVICTSAGLVVIDLKTGKPIGPAEPDAGHRADFCQFCLPILHGTTSLPVTDGVPLPTIAPARTPAPVPTADAAVRGRRGGTIWPRGPPEAIL